jgi:protoheme IX farnesyltransferase
MCHGSLLPNLEYHELVEWTHRLIALLVGILMAVTVISTLLWYRRPRRLLWMALLAATTYLAQAILGGITVLLNLDRTWIAAHMGNSMLLLASVILLATFSRISLSPKPEREASLSPKLSSQAKWLRGVALGALLWTYVGLFTGSAVIGAEADVACSAWPQCSESQFFPATPGEWVNFGHRLAIGLSDVLLLTLAVMIWRSSRGQPNGQPKRNDRRLINTGRILGGFYVAQVFVGAFTIWLGAPSTLKGIHLALAAATWGALVLMTTFIWSGDGRVSGIGDQVSGDGESDTQHPSPDTIPNTRHPIPDTLPDTRHPIPDTLPDTRHPIPDTLPDTRHPIPVTLPNTQHPSPDTLPNTRHPIPVTLPNTRHPIPDTLPDTRHPSPDTLPDTRHPSPVRNYIGLMRLQVIPLLLIPTVASMLIAAVQHPPQEALLALIGWTMLGGTLATGGAHAINQYLDRDLDAKMRRTRKRAIVSGRITPNSALAFGIILTVVAIGQLWLTVNALAAMLALAGNLFYVFVYTLWLKRITPQNIVIGGASGAVPPLVGWAAVTGRLDLPAILFFAIIFFWTPAHFWALALVRQNDYKDAGVPMLPVVRGEAFTRLNILGYTVLMVGATLLPVMLHALSWLYLVTATGLGLWFIFKAVRLMRLASTALAWKLFKFSNNYLAVLYAVMVLDRLLALNGLLVL